MGPAADGCVDDYFFGEYRTPVAFTDDDILHEREHRLVTLFYCLYRLTFKMDDPAFGRVPRAAARSR
jgi:hypothetical protein